MPSKQKNLSMTITRRVGPHFYIHLFYISPISFNPFSETNSRLRKGGSYVDQHSDLLEFFFFFGFLKPHLGHMEVPRLRVKSEQQLLATAMAIAMGDLSHVCDLHHSSHDAGSLTH